MINTSILKEMLQKSLMYMNQKRIHQSVRGKDNRMSSIKTRIPYTHPSMGGAQV